MHFFCRLHYCSTIYKIDSISPIDTLLFQELNEDELEDRLYAMLHYAEDTQPQETLPIESQHNAPVTASTPRQSTVRRYWRTSGGKTSQNTPFHKTYSPNTNISQIIDNKQNIPSTKPKQEKSEISINNTSDLSVLQSPISSTTQRTIEILENDENKVVELESSDEDEVIEVALPPKPTITIESSDEEEVQVLKCEHSSAKPTKGTTKQSSNVNCKKNVKTLGDGDRDISASPVPSVVSSVSDDFIRGDCIALNISSKHLDQPSFDFSLHGNDLLGQSTPTSKRKKKKKNKDKDKNISSPVLNVTNNTSTNPDGQFATPKNKSNKNKKHKNDKQTPDMYDSDSNPPLLMDKKRKRIYSVSQQGIPNADVYDTDSNQSTVIDIDGSPMKLDELMNPACNSLDMPLTANMEKENNVIASKQQNQVDTTLKVKEVAADIVDLTNDINTTLSQDNIQIIDDIVVANVTGFVDNNEVDTHDDQEINPQNTITKLGSTKVPPILEDNLDFDNLKGNSRVSRRRYSLTTLRAEMEKFYNESWGGENFNHREIQKSMSRK